MKLALSLLIHMIGRRREAGELSPALQFAISRTVPITQALLSAGIGLKTAEEGQIVGELVLLHREVLRLCKRAGLESEYAAALQTVVPSPCFPEYCTLLGTIADFKDTADLKQPLSRLKELLVAKQ